VIDELNKRIKNLDMWDMGSTKIAVMFFVMFLLAVWPAFANFFLSVNPWILFFGLVIFAIRPLTRFFSKNN